MPGNCGKGFSLTGPQRIGSRHAGFGALSRSRRSPGGLAFSTPRCSSWSAAICPTCRCGCIGAASSEDAIALLLAAPLFARILFTPVISFAADWSGARRTVLIALAWGTLLSFLLLWASGGFWQMLLATLLLAFNWTTIMPLIEAVAVSGVRSAGLDYGRVRLWGSGSFILASFGAGLLIGQLGAASVLPMLVGATVLMIAGVYLLPRDVASRPSPSHARASPHQPRRRRQARPLAVLPAVPACRERHPGKPRALLHLRHARIGARKASPTEPSARSGRSASSPRSGCSPSQGRSSRDGAPRMLLAAGAAAAVRWGLMAFDPPLWATAMLQCLHAMSFGAAHLAAIYFLSQAVPEDRGATAQGVYAAVVAGLVLGLVTIACGPLYRSLRRRGLCASWRCWRWSARRALFF